MALARFPRSSHRLGCFEGWKSKLFHQSPGGASPAHQDGPKIEAIFRDLSANTGRVAVRSRTCRPFRRYRGRDETSIPTPSMSAKRQKAESQNDALKCPL